MENLVDDPCTIYLRVCLTRVMVAMTDTEHFMIYLFYLMQLSALPHIRDGIQEKSREKKMLQEQQQQKVASAFFSFVGMWKLPVKGLPALLFLSLIISFHNTQGIRRCVFWIPCIRDTSWITFPVNCAVLQLNRILVYFSFLFLIQVT